MRRKDVHRTQRQVMVPRSARRILAASAIASVVACADRITEPVSRVLSDSSEARLGVLPPAGTWQVTTLASLGGTLMRGIAINDAGVVAGWGSNGANKTVAFRWSSGTLTTIGMPVFYESARARAINSAGRIVGDVTLLSGQKKGFTSVPGVLAQLLPVWANSADGDHIPYGVSDADVVVGDSPGLIPVIWTLAANVWNVGPAPTISAHYDAISGSLVAGTKVDPADAFRDGIDDGLPIQEVGALGPQPLETYATDINANGDVAGIATREGVPPTYFFKPSGGKLANVGVQAINPVGLDDHIGAVSNTGRIVGVDAATLLPFTKRSGVFQTLPLPAGAVFGFAEDVNTCGVTTGWVLYNDWSTRAVIWRRYNGHQLLCD